MHSSSNFQASPMSVEPCWFIMGHTRNSQTHIEKKRQTVHKTEKGPVYTNVTTLKSSNISSQPYKTD